MKIKSVGFLLLLLVFFSCQKEIKELEFEKVYLKEKLSGIKIDDIFQKIELVELNFGDEEKWIGNIDIYKVSENNIYLLDEYQGKKIVKFDLEGNFVSEINSLGDSPAGFNMPSILSIDEVNDELIVFDRTLLKLLYYDLDFNFLKSEKLKSYFSNIAHLKSGNGILFFTDDIIKESNGYVLVYKRSNGAFESILHTRHKIIPYLSEHLFFNDYSQFYHLPFEDKIYKYDEISEKFNPLFQVMLNTEEIPSKLLNSSDIVAIQSYLLENERKFVSFNGADYNDHYFFFYHNNLESYNISKINKQDFDNNISIPWSSLFKNSELPVPFSYREGVYFSVGYLSQSGYNRVIETIDTSQGKIEFPDFKEKLFLFKFHLK